MESKIMDNMKCWFTIIVIITANLLSISAEPIPLLEELPHNENGEPQSRVRVRRQYYVCPPEFELISNNCYYFSRIMATWQDAHYDCRDRHSELAMLQTPAEDKKLRGQLNKLTTPMEWWIGGIYDWEQMKWKWGTSGKKLDYHGFSRMGPENKEKLKWHCIILDPHMKYKWSARSCVHGKHYICQKKVMRVNERGLKKLRKQYNNALNEIPAPNLHDKPRKNKKHENFANGHGPVASGLKQNRPNGVNLHPNYKQFNNAFGHRRNSTTELRKGRKKGQGRKKNRKNRNNKGLELHLRNGTMIENGSYPGDYRRLNRKRNRRNKSKESKENNSLENSTFSQDEINKRKRKKWNKDNSNSMEDMTQKTSYMANTISPLHPRVIVEEHDFLELNHH